MEETQKEYMTFEEVIQRAAKIAQKAHEGQKRRDGKPYITHPAAMVAMVDRDYSPCSSLAYLWLTVICWLHDVFEDNPEYRPYLDSLEKFHVLFDGKLSNAQLNIYYRSLVALTRKPDEDYADFIFRIKEEGGAWAIIAKQLDLAHNLSDSKPGSLRDKYLLAYYVLSGRKYKKEDYENKIDLRNESGVGVKGS